MYYCDKHSEKEYNGLQSLKKRRNVCDKQFIKLSSLRAHVHSKPVSQKCTQCSKEFKNKTKLKKTHE